ncbi:MAG TPA: hypothetical protein VN861_16715 [Candidatus Acidoferrales bacterium]|nr:hypothetical protein [Candidatus Acidoferrales bacterium]
MSHRITDANSHVTTITYDAFGRVTETSFPSTHYEQYAYDAANNLISKTDRQGQTINYVYDDMNRLTQKTYPDSTSVEYVYDLVGKIRQVTDPTGTYGFAYDNMGRLVGTTTAGGEPFPRGTGVNICTIETRGVPNLFCAVCRKGSGFDLLPDCLQAFPPGFDN